MKPTTTHPTALRLQYSQYEPLLSRFDLTLEEKQALLEALFQLSVSLVDQAYYGADKSTVNCALTSYQTGFSDHNLIQSDHSKV